MKLLPPISLVSPQWNDPIVDDVLALEELRYPNPDRAATHPVLYAQLRDILQTLESVASARIEGNRTTIADYLDAQRGVLHPADEYLEIINIERAIAAIEADPERAIDLDYIKDIHQLVVAGLKREGDRAPGQFRDHAVRIVGTPFRPPQSRLQIEAEMRHLIDFAQRSISRRDELLRIALFHHRFMAIHPFGNGNGRTGRLVTYAMLLKGGYRADIGQTINPAAVFCLDRHRYYQELSNADQFTEAGQLSWCTYLIGELRNEIDRLNRLADFDYVTKEILYPSLDQALALARIKPTEHRILRLGIRRRRIRNKDLQEEFGWTPPQSSRVIRELKDRNLIIASQSNQHLNYVQFTRSPLTLTLIGTLLAKGFAIPPDPTPN